jgi:hypothetical protein
MEDAHPDAGLLVEPEILGLPKLRRVFQPEVEFLQSQRNELMYLAQRYLGMEQSSLAHAAYSGTKTGMLYILADTSACAGAEVEIMFVQSSSVLSQPSLRLELVNTWTKDVLVVPHDRGVHTDVTTSRNMRSRYLEPTHWCNSRHSQADTGVQTHCFFDGCAQERQIRCLAELWWRAQLPRTGCIIDLSE